MVMIYVRNIYAFYLNFWCNIRLLHFWNIFWKLIFHESLHWWVLWKSRYHIFSISFGKIKYYYLESRLTDLCTISHQIFFLKLFFLDILQQKNLKHIIFRVGNLTHNLTHHSHQPRKLQTTPEFFLYFQGWRSPMKFLETNLVKKKITRRKIFFCLWKLLKIYFPLVFEGTTDK